MKKVIAILLLISSLLSLIACGESKYPPVESTDEEKRVIMTFKYEKQTYEVKYELYRALFLNFAADYDKGDKTFWSTPDADAAKESINARITDFCLDIYAAIHLSKKLGYDPFSKNADDRIEEYIAESVDGNGADIAGFGGDYDAYLESLKKMNMNYSVQVLLLRYSMAYEKIIDHYAGTFNENNPSQSDVGALEYTEEDIRAFYDGDGCVRVSLIEINPKYISRKKAENMRDEIAAITGEEAALKHAVQFTASDAKDIMDGVLIGRYSLDGAYYSTVIDTAFDLAPYSTSSLLDVTTDNQSYYWILYKREKTESYFEKNYQDIVNVYVSDSIGSIINGVKTELAKTEEKSQLFDEIDHSQISMP
ncbi:MAG: hypothetical protein E7617_07295 [Ruminococcaceae bacterium]|nr:hypothetical protein [Oscillospiraceae bacterium]